MFDLSAALYVYRQIADRPKQDEKYTMTSTNNTLQTDKNDAIIRINKALTALSLKLQTMSVNQIKKFSFQQDIHLRVALTTLKQVRHKETAKLVKLIFNDMFQFNNLRTQVTEIFDEFVKGITLFNHDLPAQPIDAPAYHRPKSCGPRSSPDRKCAIDDGPSELEINKKLAFTCYIERLIYNEIHTRYNLYFPPNSSFDIYSAQDEGHVAKIKRVCNDFETCFPNIKIVVELGFDKIEDLEYPSSCRIIQTSKRLNQLVSSELFIKEVNQVSTNYNDLYLDHNVFIMKNVKASTIYKCQTFYKPNNKWLKSSPYVEIVIDNFFKKNLLD